MPEHAKPLRILVTNDDGIDAPNLLPLVEMAVKFGEVTVVAPTAQCSAMSQRLTLFQEILVEEADYPVPGVRAWRVDGTPADCVKLAVLELLPEKPDIVFSGMNRGYNTGFDIAYSGTVGACKEAAIQNIPSIAYSTDSHGCGEVPAAYLEPLTAECLARPLPRGAFWNINFPGCPLSEMKGIIRNAPIADTPLYADNYRLVSAPGEPLRFTAHGRAIAPEEAPEGTDVWAVLHGCISVGIVRSEVFPAADRRFPSIH